MSEQDTSFEDRILTVSEYLDLVNEYLKPLNFSIIGEISSVSDRAGNTVFFSVSDEEEQAVVDCVIWRNIYRNLGFKLEEGMQVKINGHPNIYKPRGSFSYVARSVIPTGEGALLKAFEELKKNLAEKGFFAPERKRPLPSYIKKVGLITADNSDAKKDFETHVENFGTTVYFKDVRVEGFKAVDNIIRAIQYFNENPMGIEVLVLTRGGGSLESLQAFNSEGVARAVYSSKIPVLSAIGHERDITISDMVADVRGSTPTDAGKIISKDWREAENQLRQIKKTIISRFSYGLNRKQVYLQNLAQNLFLNFQSIFNRFLEIQRIFGRNETRFEAHIKARRAGLATLQRQMIGQYNNRLKNLEERMELTTKLLDANDPKQKLKQGYSITRKKGGKIVKSTKDITKGDILSTYFIDGEAETQVQKITESPA